jgi:AraC family transcriptional regulator
MIVKNLQRKEYLARINRVMDFIDKNISSKFTLEELASIANFSKFHFHRVFKGVLGETLSNYVLRIRLEKAATLLIFEPNKPITEICFDCGFSSSSVFARAFKENFGLSAGEFRHKKFEAFSNIGQLNSNPGEVKDKLDAYFGEVLLTKKGDARMKNLANVIEPANIEVKHMEEITVAYLRYIGPYKGDAQLFDNLFTRLFNWAEPKNLCNLPKTKVMAVYHDNPDITEEEKLRLSVCISVPADTQVDGEIGKMNIIGGQYVVASYKLNGPKDYEPAWNYIFGEWFPSSGYVPEDKPCFELYLNDPKTHPENKHVVDIYVPVKSI